MTYQDVLDKAKSLGAAITHNVTRTVTHLITTEQEVADNTSKVRHAKKFGKAKMVSLDWLEKCEEEGDHVPEDEFELKPPAPDAESKDASTSAPSSSSSAAALAPVANGIKRSPSPAPLPAPAKKRSKKNGELFNMPARADNRCEAVALAGARQLGRR